ncbi:hypothetical protein V5F53_07890 [Xanthobacter sp. V4C-4]
MPVDPFDIMHQMSLGIAALIYAVHGTNSSGRKKEVDMTRHIGRMT